MFESFNFLIFNFYLFFYFLKFMYFKNCSDYSLKNIAEDFYSKLKADLDQLFMNVKPARKSDLQVISFLLSSLFLKSDIFT
jgi:hypothetical protein